MSSGKRKQFTINDKLHLVDRVRKGESQAKVSRDGGVSESTLRLGSHYPDFDSRWAHDLGLQQSYKVSLDAGP